MMEWQFQWLPKALSPFPDGFQNRFTHFLNFLEKAPRSQDKLILIKFRLHPFSLTYKRRLNYSMFEFILIILLGLFYCCLLLTSPRRPRLFCLLLYLRLLAFSPDLLPDRLLLRLSLNRFASSFVFLRSASTSLFACVVGMVDDSD